MKEYIAPHFEDDSVSPKKIDIPWLTRMLIYILIIMWGIYALFYAWVYLIIWWFSLEDEKRFFGEMLIEESYIPLDIHFLSEDITIEHPIYISPSSELNAYAVLWGNIIFTRWILETFRNEEEFVFVLWHEISHIENRDIMNYYSQHMPIYLTLSLIGFDFDMSLVQNFLSQSQELGADKAWLEFLKKYWYNSDCVIWFFEEEDMFRSYIWNTLASTHPSNRARTEQITDFQAHTEKNCRPFSFEW